MSMHLALRPYVTAGIALVGASVIAVAPIAPHPDVPLPTVHLTAAIDNPIEVFAPVVGAAGTWLTNTIQSEIANPFPILHQILTNQITTAGQVLQAINAGGAALGDLAAGLPATLQTALGKLSTGDVNGAIDSIIASGLNPIISLITGVWTPLQEVLQRPFAVGQALVPALFNAGLSLTLAAVASTVGIGFDTGLTPLVQQIVSSTQSVLTAVTTLNPINVLNAIQHGLADVALNVVAQLDSFTTGTLPYIRDSLVAALQATPAAPLAVTAANLATRVAPESSAPARAEIESGSNETVSTPVDSDAAPAAEPAPSIEENAAQHPAATETAPDTTTHATPAVAAPDAEVAGSTASRPTGPVVRDSVKAEPGKVSTVANGGASSPTPAADPSAAPAQDPSDESSAGPGATTGSSDTGSGDASSGSDSDAGGSGGDA